MTLSPLAQALAGVRVLDLSRLLPGPFLTMVLADMGADVVKIEDPRVGDYLRVLAPQKGGVAGRFYAINRGKRSLALDLKSEAGRAAFLRMVRSADVVVESFRPGVLDKLGLGWSQLHELNPALTLCSISGYGQTGPYAHRAGHDLNYVALSGALAMSGGERGGAPALSGVQIADLAGGALWASTMITAALLQRHRTGHGVWLDVSMTDGALALLAAELGNLDCGAEPRRGEETLNGGVAAYHVYRTADDRYLAVGALEPKFWTALHAALGRPLNLAELAGGPAQQATLRQQLADIFATRSRDAWVTDLAAHDCCVEPVLEVSELDGHPLHVARNNFFTMDGGVSGDIRQVRTPVGMPATLRAPPRLGEQSREVLAEYQFSDDEIRSLIGP